MTPLVQVLQLLADNACLADSRLLSHYTASTSQHQPVDRQSSESAPCYATDHEQHAAEQNKQPVYDCDGFSHRKTFWNQPYQYPNSSMHQRQAHSSATSSADNRVQCNDEGTAASHRQAIAELAEAPDNHSHDNANHSSYQAQCLGEVPPTSPPPRPPGRGWLRWFGFGVVTAVVLQFVVGWLLVSPVWERFFGRFVWNRGAKPAAAATPAAPSGLPQTQSTALVLYSDSAETVEWVNMMWRKVPCPPAALALPNPAT